MGVTLDESSSTIARMGWGIVILHFVFMVWFGYYLINPEKRDMA